MPVPCQQHRDARQEAAKRPPRGRQEAAKRRSETANGEEGQIVIAGDPQRLTIYFSTGGSGNPATTVDQRQADLIHLSEVLCEELLDPTPLLGFLLELVEVLQEQIGDVVDRLEL
jgi:hypothetical protein